MLYSAIGPELSRYDVDVEAAALTRGESVTLPANVQYAWPHPLRRYLYVVSSDGGPGVPGRRNFASALRVDRTTGALQLHGDPVLLPSRPIHASVDLAGGYLLTAYNDPSGLTIHRIAADGTLGNAVTQPAALDTGKYAHQIRVTPDNRHVILVTRGNNAPEDIDDSKVDPGSLKVFDFKDGVLSNLVAIQPDEGMRFGPRHLDFHPTLPLVYVSIESQNKLFVYRRDAATALSRDPLFTVDTLTDPRRVGPRQHAGAIHVHPNGRFVYVTNRASATVTLDGQAVAAGGPNNVAVFALDPATGAPRLLDNVDGHAFELRTFAIDPSGRLLVAASIKPMMAREAGGLKPVTAGLTAFRIGDDGGLTFVRKYDLDVAGRTQFWSGMVTIA